MNDAGVLHLTLALTRKVPEPVALPSRYVLLGHRGYARNAPENTIQACLDALDAGAAGVEIDLRCALDGEAVVFHDADLFRMAGVAKEVSALPLSQLQAVVLKHGQGRFADTVPTFEQLLDALPSGTFINLEVKDAPPRHLNFEQRIIKTLARFSSKFRFVLSSFNPLSLLRFRRLGLTVPIGLLLAPDLKWPLRNGVLMPLIRPASLHAHHSMIDARLVQAVQDRNLRLYAWTVNQASEARRLRDLGVNGIITDKTERLRDL